MQIYSHKGGRLSYFCLCPTLLPVPIPGYSHISCPSDDAEKEFILYSFAKTSQWPIPGHSSPYCSSNRLDTHPPQVFCACSFLFLKGSFSQGCTWLPSPFSQTQLKCYLPSLLHLRQRLPTLHHLTLCLAWYFSITFTII